MVADGYWARKALILREELAPKMPPQQILDEREKDVVCLKNGSRLDGLRFNNSQQQCMETVFGVQYGGKRICLNFGEMPITSNLF